MSERISPQQFHEAEGVDGWRVLFSGACAHVRTESFTAGVALVDAIGRLTGAAGRRPAAVRRDGALENFRWVTGSGAVPL